MKKLLAAIGLFIRTTFSRVFRQLAPHAATAVKITRALQTFLNSPVADLLTFMIQGDWDDKLREKLRTDILPKVILHLANVHQLIDASENDHVVALEKLRDYVLSLNPELHKTAWTEIAATFTAAIADGEFTWNELVSVSQLMHKYLYPNEAKVFTIGTTNAIAA